MSKFQKICYVTILTLLFSSVIGMVVLDSIKMKKFEEKMNGDGGKVLKVYNTAEASTVTITPEVCLPTEEDYIGEYTPGREAEFATLNNIPLDEDFQYYLFNVCNSYNVNPYIIIAMIEKESEFNPNAVGDNGNSYGLMQIYKKYHTERMERLGVTDLKDPYQNIVVGIDYYAEILNNMYSDESIALMRYNGGSEYVKNMLSRGEISEYSRTITARAAELEEYAYSYWFSYNE